MTPILAWRSGKIVCHQGFSYTWLYFESDNIFLDFKIFRVDYILVHTIVFPIFPMIWSFSNVKIKYSRKLYIRPTSFSSFKIHRFSAILI